VKVLTVTLVADVSILALVGLLMGPLGLDVQWAWIPPRYWRWFQFLWSILVPPLLYVATGAIASILVWAREMAVAVSFARWASVYSIWLLYILSYSSARGRLPRTFNLAELNEQVVIQWTGTVLLYFIGCLCIRRRRLAGVADRVR
jgi:hypothetical protein